jgi:hypothetical protein
MSKAAAAKAKRKAWRACTGVNSRTGRVKRGFKVKKGGCPVPAPKRLSAKAHRKAKAAYAAGMKAELGRWFRR